MELERFLDGRVVVTVGDLTMEDVDAIVNAANSSLMGGGGVDAAIHAAGGPQILGECRKIRKTIYPDGLPTGKAVLTSGGNLPARYVIHTVGPIFGQNRGRDAELLATSYYNSLKLASENELSTIAFPAISTGVYDYPKDDAAQVASKAIKEFLNADELLQQVRLVFFKRGDAHIFLENHNL